MATEHLLHSPEGLNEAADWLLEQMGNERLLCLNGDLGAGKTTLIKAVCERIGVRDMVSSPTYAIINEYLTEGGQAVYHLDLYRIEKEEELLDIGTQEIIDSGDWCFIEWPEIASALIPHKCLHLHIVLEEDKRRKLTIFRE